MKYAFLPIWLACASVVMAQDAIEMANSHEPIPRDYKSWSMFLINNPDWLLPPQDRDKVGQLYESFEAFGRAIGHEHAAMWFWRESPYDVPMLRAVDVARASAITRQLKLLPSEGPFIIFTTDYPGECIVEEFPKTFNSTWENSVVMSLNGLSANEIREFLKDMTDKVIAEKYDEITSPSHSWLQAIYDAAKGSVLGFTNRIRIKVSAKFLEAELEPRG